MFLIMSAAYIEQELRAEFGHIPPTFLPLGNRRLFQHQINLVPDGKKIYMSIPESFQVSQVDKDWLNNKKVTVIPIPDNLELGASLVAVLNLIEEPLDRVLHVLFGDTLLQHLPQGDDVIAISGAVDSYDWAYISNNEQDLFKDVGNDFNSKHHIVSGYFKFSQIKKIIRCITLHKWNFLDGVNAYHQDVGLSVVKAKGWLDFGHVNTYYRSKAEFTTQRAFNDLIINPNWIEKSSYKKEKIQAEAHWFDSIPPMLRSFTPQYLGDLDVNDNFSYRLEYLHHTSLNELFVFAEISSAVWTQIISSALCFIDACSEYLKPNNDSSSNLNELFNQKTESRVNQYCCSRNYDRHKQWNYNGMELSLDFLINQSELFLPKKNVTSTVMHGDFCFSNILYDFRINKIKTIDPRGLTFDNTLTIYGDFRYDLAKLSHSILGMYDWIIAGYYDVNISDDNIDFHVFGLKKHKEIQQIFIKLVEEKYGLTATNLYAMQIQLFLSMLPLHADEPKRQDALMANAFRLYEKMIGCEQ